MRPTRALLRLLLLSAGAATYAAETFHQAQVTYFTGATIYLNAGSEEGLDPGTELIVKRGNEVVAICAVGAVSTHKASCNVDRQLLDPTPGDTAVFVVPEHALAETTDEDDAPRRRRRRGTARRAGLKGRIGVRYLVVRDRSPTGESEYSQPAMDLRLDGSQIGGTPWGMNVDVRARRTTRIEEDGTSENDSLTRVYRAAFSREGIADPWNFTLGRQFSPAAAAVGVFDGLSAEFDRPRWAVGLLSGSQPDPVDHGYSDVLREHGLYVRVNGNPAAERRWLITTGLIGSYEESEINREFLYVQARMTGRKLSLYAAEEVDYNRDWKAQAGEDAVALTSTFASLHYRADRRVVLRAGYDNRRSVRLYRDFVNPETEFDDSFREGIWAGVTTNIARRFSFSMDGRTNSGGGAGTSKSLTASFGAHRMAGRFDLRTRSTRYENEIQMGWLHSLTGGVRLGRIVHFQLTGGLRREEDLSGATPEEELVWFNADLDLLLGRHWYLIMSADSTRGDLERVEQYYSGVTYRF